jgi:hypothetical protein
VTRPDIAGQGWEVTYELVHKYANAFVQSVEKHDKRVFATHDKLVIATHDKRAEIRRNKLERACNEFPS